MRWLGVNLRRLEYDPAREPLQWYSRTDPARVETAVAEFDKVIAPLQARFDLLAGVPDRGGASKLE